jgi:hypothetical protein
VVSHRMGTSMHVGPSFCFVIIISMLLPEMPGELYIIFFLSSTSMNTMFRNGC